MCCHKDIPSFALCRLLLHRWQSSIEYNITCESLESIYGIHPNHDKLDWFWPDLFGISHWSFFRSLDLLQNYHLNRTSICTHLGLSPCVVYKGTNLAVYVIPLTLSNPVRTYGLIVNLITYWSIAVFRKQIYSTVKQYKYRTEL